MAGAPGTRTNGGRHERPSSWTRRGHTRSELNQKLTVMKKKKQDYFQNIPDKSRYYLNQMEYQKNEANVYSAYGCTLALGDLRKSWHFELEESDFGPTMLRAVAICNGTVYKSLPQRLSEPRQRLAAALCLHSLTARLVSLMYNQRSKAYKVIRLRYGKNTLVEYAMEELSKWVEWYGRRMDWTDHDLDGKWRVYASDLRARLLDLVQIGPAKNSPFYDNYVGKFRVIYSISTGLFAVADLPGMIPETMPAEQLSLF